MRIDGMGNTVVAATEIVEFNNKYYFVRKILRW